MWKLTQKHCRVNVEPAFKCRARELGGDYAEREAARLLMRSPFQGCRGRGTGEKGRAGEKGCIVKVSMAAVMCLKAAPG